MLALCDSHRPRIGFEKLKALKTFFEVNLFGLILIGVVWKQRVVRHVWRDAPGEFLKHELEATRQHNHICAGVVALVLRRVLNAEAAGKGVEVVPAGAPEVFRDFPCVDARQGLLGDVVPATGLRDESGVETAPVVGNERGVVSGETREIPQGLRGRGRVAHLGVGYASEVRDELGNRFFRFHEGRKSFVMQYFAVAHPHGSDLRDFVEIRRESRCLDVVDYEVHGCLRRCVVGSARYFCI